MPENQNGKHPELKVESLLIHQKQLAASLGVTEQAVSKWERGTGYPDITMLDGISEVLESSLDFLFQIETGKRSLLSQI